MKLELVNVNEIDGKEHGKVKAHYSLLLPLVDVFERLRSLDVTKGKEYDFTLSYPSMGFSGVVLGID